MAVSKRLRFEILRRDNHACRYCGQTAPDVKLTVDHVVPTTLGGTDEPTNLVTACADCNSGKSATPPDAVIVADVSEKAAVYAEHCRRALQEWRDEMNEVDRFRSLWNSWSGTRADGSTYTAPLPPDWGNTVKVWMARGFTLDDLHSQIEHAMTPRGVQLENRWRYYCGIIWRILNDVDRRAAELNDRAG